MGGGRRALELLGVRVACYISIESNEEAQRVVARAWPRAHAVCDVRVFLLCDLQTILQSYPHIRHVFLTAGVPCQGVSGLNAGRRGFDDPRSTLVTEVPPLR